MTTLLPADPLTEVGGIERAVLGVDVGGTKTLGVAMIGGNICATHEIPTRVGPTMRPASAAGS